jgi:hypothetical protein
VELRVLGRAAGTRFAAHRGDMGRWCSSSPGAEERRDGWTWCSWSFGVGGAGRASRCAGGATGGTGTARRIAVSQHARSKWRVPAQRTWRRSECRSVEPTRESGSSEAARGGEGMSRIRVRRARRTRYRKDGAGMWRMSRPSPRPRRPVPMSPTARCHPSRALRSRPPTAAIRRRRRREGGPRPLLWPSGRGCSSTRARATRRRPRSESRGHGADVVVGAMDAAPWVGSWRWCETGRGSRFGATRRRARMAEGEAR